MTLTTLTAKSDLDAAFTLTRHRLTQLTQIASDSPHRLTLRLRFRTDGCLCHYLHLGDSFRQSRATVTEMD